MKARSATRPAARGRAGARAAGGGGDRGLLFPLLGTPGGVGRGAPAFTVYGHPWSGSQPASARQGLVAEQSTGVVLQMQLPVVGSNVPLSWAHLLLVLHYFSQV